MIMESRINVNGHNATGTIATDIVPDHEIQMTASRASTSTSNNALATLVKKRCKKKKPTKSQENWLEKTQNTLMIVATLIAGMALQVGVNHPSGGSVWQQDGDTHTGAVGASTFSLYSYEFFLICNTIGFVASFIIILIFVSGFPLRWRVIIWVMRVIMWVALTAMIVTYLSSITVLAPKYADSLLNTVIDVVLYAWVGVILLLILGHTIHLLMRIIPLIVKGLWKLMKLTWKKLRLMKLYLVQWWV
ncbi:hypothetical protein U1Q18_028163 [Sarracenia purpurea var. burkii]